MVRDIYTETQAARLEALTCMCNYNTYTTVLSSKNMVPPMRLLIFGNGCHRVYESG